MRRKPCSIKFASWYHPVIAPAELMLAGWGQHRTRRIERDEGAVGRAQEAVRCSTVRVTIVSRDVPCLIDVCGVRVRCTGRIERGEGAVGSAQEAMIHVLRVSVVSRDRANPVNALREGPGGARRI